jgi:AraC-like DNA-binding protein
MLVLTVEHQGCASLADLGRELGKSSYHSGRLFARRTGTTFRHHALCVRTRRAAELLRDPRRSVKEVAGLLGYADASNFAREFHRMFGISPSDFRESRKRGKHPR